MEKVHSANVLWRRSLYCLPLKKLYVSEENGEEGEKIDIVQYW